MAARCPRTDPAWEPLSVARRYAPGVSTVTRFQGHGVEAFVDQKSRTPEGLYQFLGGRRVSADMFRLGLRTYQRKIQRLGESHTERRPRTGRSTGVSGCRADRLSSNDTLQAH